ncbi:MAG: hypothetical protein CMH54_03950 [Myxococcales bacterium]|nr:hypothetical protein [Myxococcales bacterium]
MLGFRVIGVAIFWVLLVPAALASQRPKAWVDEVPRSFHAWELENHRYDIRPVRTPQPHEPSTSTRFPSTLSGQDMISYGYLPYWEFDAEIPWSELTHLGYFSVGVDGTGELINDHGWGSDAQLQLVEEAHSHGVRVDLVITLFNANQLASLLNNESHRDHFVANLVDAVVTGNADGVNLDFELLPVQARSSLVSLVLELGAALEEVAPETQISLAMPAVDWDGAYDYDLLSASSDFLFIMCYGYHWGGGPPGPNAPLHGSVFGDYSIEWTINDYIEWGGDGITDRLVIGLPSYGRRWPTTGPEIPGTALENGVVRTYRQVLDWPGLSSFTFDPELGEFYYVDQSDGTWHQLFIDLGESTATKVEYALGRGLRGYGFWALGYDANDPAYWSPIRDAVHTALGFSTGLPGEDTGSQVEPSQADVYESLSTDTVVSNDELDTDSMADIEGAPMTPRSSSGGCSAGIPVTGFAPLSGILGVLALVLRRKW